ncbi:MAG: chemotaxis protein CheB [Pseudomonadota bacterium]
MDEEIRLNDLAWVGIGASAGGLDALRALLSKLGSELPATFVVVQHMAPQHRSLLTELLSREAKIPVVEVRDGCAPLAGHVYVTPPNHDVIVENRRLKLLPPSDQPASPKPSVDRFFRSLGREIGEHAVGVILSGTGSDGAYGVQEIRACGGITIVQSEGSAQYSGMPSAAIDTGCVDLIFPPDKIAENFAGIISRPRNLESLIDPGINSHDDEFAGLCRLLEEHTGVDFRQYKTNTLRRRIERRIAAVGAASLEGYVDTARGSKTELDSLFSDLLISVTSFFRDQREFDTLVPYIQQLVSERGNSGIRIWVPGCATGEEAYTLAILFCEAFGGIGRMMDIPLQIFGTDVDERALAVARRGTYPPAALDDIPESYVEPYFSVSQNGNTVSKWLRDKIVFSRHNLCQNPPFRNIDLVSCRNLLIYFRPELQRQVLQRLHFGLSDGGLLFVGRSESITGAEDLFRPIGQARRIFRRASALSGRPQTLSGFQYRPTHRQIKSAIAAEKREERRRIRMLDSLVKSVAPHSLIVDESGYIRRVYGDVSPFSAMAEGDVRTTLGSLLLPEFSQQIRNLIRIALRSPGQKRAVTMQMRREEGKQVTISIFHFEDGEEGADSEKLFVVSFEIHDVEAAEDRDGNLSGEGIAALERELELTRENLQLNIEELETSNEEMQALNEELQSTNEELQATNEELETANEELQSSNEELTTVNQELHVSTQELDSVNHDLNSILSHVASPLMVVDTNLQITRMSEAAKRLFDIDIGAAQPHVSVCRLPDGYPPLTPIFSAAMSGGTLVERQITSDTLSVTLRVAPYVNRQREVKGAVAVFSDNTARLLETQRALRTSEERFDLAVKGARIGLWDLDVSSGRLFLSEVYLEVLGLLGDGFRGGLEDLLERVHPSDRARFRDALDAHFSEREPLQLEHRIRHLDGTYRWIETRGQASWDADGKPVRCVGSADDVTERKAIERRLSERTKLMLLAQEVAKVGHWHYDVAHGETVWSAQVYAIHGMTPGGLAPSPEASVRFFHPDDRAMVTAKIRRSLKQGAPGEFTARLSRADGTEALVQWRCMVERGEDGEVSALFGVLIDVTDMHQTAELRRALKDLATSNAELERFGYVCSHDLREPVRTIAGFAELILHGGNHVNPQEREDYLRRILKNSDRLMDIINALMAFSRLDATVPIEPVDLARIFDDAADALGSLVETHKAKITRETLPVLDANSTHMRQLFQNLIGNAIKYGGETSPEIRATAQDTGPAWVISIEDNGQGVPEEQRESIFSLFNRLHRKGEVEGAGMGLPICRKIVRLCGGEIWCDESALGGAAFRIRFPKEADLAAPPD